jgi:hypothetical protein
LASDDADGIRGMSTAVIGNRTDLQPLIEIAGPGIGSSGAVYDASLYDSSVYASGADDWVAVECDGVTATSRRGRSTAEDRFDVGTAQVTLRNPHGLYSVGGGTFTNPLRPGHRLRLSIYIFGVGRVSVYTGTVDKVVDRVDVDGSALTFITATDALSYFAAYNNPAESPQGGGELSGARVNRILDDVGFPSTRRTIDPGYVPLQETTLADNTLAELLLTTDSEGGALYASVDDKVVFRDRSWPYWGPPELYVTVTPPADETPQICPAEIREPFRDRARIRNSVTYGRVGGSAITVTDGPSTATYGPRSIQRTDLLCVSDDDVRLLAERTLAGLAEPIVRIPGVELRLDDVTVTTDEVVAALAIGFGSILRVEVPAESWSYWADAVVEGIEHRFDPDRWTVSYATDRTAVLPYPDPDDPGLWILNVSALDETTELAA